MKQTFTVALFFWLCSGFGQEKINNSSVIQLVKQGFDPEIIVAKINYSETSFDVSIDGLQELKENNVPQDIIKLMMDRSSTLPRLRSGIYIQKDQQVYKIAPSVFSGLKSNMMASFFTLGLVTWKTKAYLTASSSGDVIESEEDQVFIFQFNEENNEYELGEGREWWFRSAESPKEFALTRLKQKRRKNERQLVIGKEGFLTANYDGVDPRKTIALRSEYLGDGKFKVTPVSRLASGEYCFFYHGSLTMGQFNDQVIFDFSIE